ncbi:hypothetical protein D3C85_1819100 [compost metagenome]
MVAELMPLAHDHARLRQVFFGLLTGQKESRFYPALPQDRQDIRRKTHRRPIVEGQRYHRPFRFDPCDDATE